MLVGGLCVGADAVCDILPDAGGGAAVDLGESVITIDVGGKGTGVAEIVPRVFHARQIRTEVCLVLGGDGLPVGDLVAHRERDPRLIGVGVDAALAGEADEDARRAELAEQPP